MSGGEISDAQLLDAARAVAAEDEDRAGVATYLALVDRTRSAEPAVPTTTADAELADLVDRAWAVVRDADPATTVQDALAAVARLRLRPPPWAASPPAAPRPPAAPEGQGRLGDGAGLAAWSPPGTGPGTVAQRDAGARAVRDAVLGGRVIRVVNHHSTPPSAAGQLRHDLAWYAQRFAPVTADDVHAFLDTGRWQGPHAERPGVVPAFFDGFASAAQVAAPLCEEVGLTGWFYPPTEFLDTPAGQQRDFAARHHLGVLPEETAGTGPLAMTWDALADLARRHEVCGHTAAHATSASVVTAADVERQVLAPLARLEEVIGRVPAAWAWLGGTRATDAPGDRAVRDAGVRLVCSNTALERVG